MHFSDTIDENAGDDRKPEVITFYKMIKNGVDTWDRQRGKNTESRNKRRWPMVLFYNLFDDSATNALGIFKRKNINKKVSRIYLLETVC
jgi:hypothetical protein